MEATAYCQTATFDEFETSRPAPPVADLAVEHGYSGASVIGRGSFGEALLVKDAHGSQRVMKAVDLLRLNPKQRGEAPLEADMMQRLRHPYIVRFRETFTARGIMAIVMDYAAAGDLLQQVEQAKQTRLALPENRVVRWVTQATLGLKYMHSLDIIHRDLKNENLFLEKEDHLRIGDFGLARVLPASSVIVEKHIVGTPYYLSPEICNDGVYSAASDIWALGCVLFELVALAVPFEAANLPSLILKITRGPAPSLPEPATRIYSEELADLCASLMRMSRVKRPTAGEVLQRPLIRETMEGLLKEVNDLWKPTTRPQAPFALEKTQKRTPFLANPQDPQSQLLGPSIPTPSSRALLLAPLVLPMNIFAVGVVQTARDAQAPPFSSRPQPGPTRSVSPDAGHQRPSLSSSAAGAPLQYLREHRRQRPLSATLLPQQQQPLLPQQQQPLQVPVLTLLQPDVDVASADRQQASHRHRLRLQLPVSGQVSSEEQKWIAEAPISALDVLAAEVLPSPAWAAAGNPQAEPHSQRGVTSNNNYSNNNNNNNNNKSIVPGIRGILRSRSATGLSSARGAGSVSSRGRLGGKQDSQVKTPCLVAPPPLKLARLKFEALPEAGLAIAALAAPRGPALARDPFLSARSMSAADLPSARGVCDRASSCEAKEFSRRDRSSSATNQHQRQLQAVQEILPTPLESARSKSTIAYPSARDRALSRLARGGDLARREINSNKRLGQNQQQGLKAVQPQVPQLQLQQQGQAKGAVKVGRLQLEKVLGAVFPLDAGFANPLSQRHVRPHSHRAAAAPSSMLRSPSAPGIQSAREVGGQKQQLAQPQMQQRGQPKGALKIGRLQLQGTVLPLGAGLQVPLSQRQLQSQQPQSHREPASIGALFRSPSAPSLHSAREKAPPSRQRQSISELRR